VCVCVCVGGGGSHNRSGLSSTNLGLHLWSSGHLDNCYSLFASSASFIEQCCLETQSVFLFLLMAGTLTVYHCPMRPIKVTHKKRKEILYFKKTKKH